MTRFCMLFSLVFTVPTVARGHFVFLLPDGNSLKVVFSDTLAPDEKVEVTKIADTRLAMADGAKTGSLTLTLDGTKTFYHATVPGEGTRVIVGATDYGVLQRGDSKPFRLTYYSKAILGPIRADDKASVGKVPDEIVSGGELPVEIVPVTDGAKIRFKALVGGKPAAKAAVSVMVPGEEKAREATTDENGLTDAFDKAGRYGARLRHVEAKSGEQGGKKFDEVRSYATLVVDFPGK